MSTTRSASSLAALVASDRRCLAAEGAYLKLAGAIQTWTPNASIGTYATIVADTDALQTDMAVVAAHAATDQRVQLDAYEATLGQFASAMQQAAAGNMQSAGASLTGIAPQFEAMIGAIHAACPV